MTDLQLAVTEILIRKRHQKDSLLCESQQFGDIAKEIIDLIERERDCPKCRQIKSEVLGELSEVENALSNFRYLLKGGR